MKDTELVNRLIPRREDLFAPFEGAFNKIFDDFFNEGVHSSVKQRVGYPKVDVLTNKDKWIVEVAVPGVTSENLTVEILPCKDVSANFGIDDNRRVLKVSGQMNEDRQYSTNAFYHVKELRRSSFERTLLLPDYVEGEPEAIMKDGILKLTWNIPGQKPPERKLIQIKT